VKLLYYIDSLHAEGDISSLFCYCYLGQRHTRVSMMNNKKKIGNT